MKLKGRKHILLKTLLVLVFMFFICYMTIEYLSNNIEISNEEYVRLLLSDSYKSKDSNFYYNVISFFTDKFNPKEMLNIPENKEVKIKNKFVSNPNKKIITDPVLYIYNTYQYEEYNSKDNIFDITPNVMMTSYILSEKLNNLGISNIVLDINLDSLNDSDYMKVTNKILADKKKKYPSLKYFIDISRDSIDSNVKSIKIDNKNYARILFMINKRSTNYSDNLELVLKLNSRLNEIYPGITRGISKDENSDYDGIRIEFGNIFNDYDEVINTVDVFSNIFKEVLYE